MLSDDKHCEMLSANIRDRTDKILDGFKLYIQLFSAIVGGCVALRLNRESEIPDSFKFLADGLVALNLLTGLIIIGQNMVSWYHMRVRLTEIAGTDISGNSIIPAPKFLSANRIEFVMLAVMLASTGGFILWNPLTLLGASHP